jgi:IMP and pyridine-specific 5'-nucleotidase
MLYHGFVLDVMKTTSLQTMEYFEDLVHEHIRDPVHSKLKQMVPTLGKFFTPLPLRQAFVEYDIKYCITNRRFVAPTFNEIRHLLNLAQINALKVRLPFPYLPSILPFFLGECPKLIASSSSSPSQNDLKFVTFDGDQTLYADGGDFYNSKLLRFIVKLLTHGVHVALVTAAGYKDAPEKYEKRLSGLLQGFRDMKVPKEVTSRFFVLGGECNYLYKCNEEAKLETVPEKEWHHEKEDWTSDEIRCVACV